MVYIETVTNSTASSYRPAADKTYDNALLANCLSALCLA